MFRSPGGFGRPAPRTLRSKGQPDKVGQLSQRGLAVAQLGTLLRSSHGDHPGDQAWSETGQQRQALAFCQRRRVTNIPQELHPTVRGVDVLAARSR